MNAPSRFATPALLIVLMLMGAALRLDFAAPNNFVIDADEGIVGLMAKHINEGRGIPTFYYGQHYMGSLEALLASVSFDFFGPTNFALKLVPLIFSILLIPLVYLIGTELGGKKMGLLSALFIAVPPAPLVVWSAKARGGFIEVIVIGALALLVTLRWIMIRPTYFRTALIAFVLGIGWWVNNQVIFFICPIALFCFLRLLYEPSSKTVPFLRILAHATLGGAVFILGGLPFWIYNLRHDFISFEMFHSSSGNELAQHFTGFFVSALPIILGAKRFWHDNEIFPLSSLLYYLVFGYLAYRFAAARWREALRPALGGPIDQRYPIELLLYFTAACFVIFTLSSFGYLVQAPRYLLPAYLGLAVLMADGILRIERASPRFARLGVGLILLLNLFSSYWGGRAIPGEPFVYGTERVARDHSELIRWLERHDYSLVRTNYWIGYRLAFETGERVKFLLSHEPAHVRLPEYEALAWDFSEARIPWILSPSQGKLISSGLTALGYQFDRTVLSGYDVIYNVDESQESLRPIPSESYSLSSNYHPETVRQAIDGNVHTRWGSAHPQTPGMQLIFDFPTPHVLRGLYYHTGDWPQDYPRGLEISVIDVSGARQVILDSASYHAVRYVLHGEHAMQMHLPTVIAKKLILEQTGSHQIFDWSVAEIRVQE